MNVCFARQPILGINRNLYGYELLFRPASDSTESAICGEIDGGRATATVLEAINIRGINVVTGGKKAFVNFTAPLLLDGVATQYPKQYLAVEVLETARNSEAVLNAIAELKEKGYTIALDDYMYCPENESLLALADIVKVETNGSREQMLNLKKVADRIRNTKALLLAEKVETEQVFHECKKVGCKLFQGYFFAKPVTLTGKTLAPMYINYLKLMAEASKPNFDFAEISNTIKRDVGLSYRVLKLVNSAYFGLPREVKSVHQATVLLGNTELKKWASLLALTEMCKGSPEELILMSLVRAHFCELTAKSIVGEEDAEAFFLAGLFSLLDTMLSTKMEVVLENVSVPDMTRRALLEGDNCGAYAKKLICAIEQGDWETVHILEEKMSLNSEKVSENYYESLRWSEALALELNG